MLRHDRGRARGSTRPTRRSRSSPAAARGSYRDAVSTLDQLASATENEDHRAVGARSSSGRSRRRRSSGSATSSSTATPPARSRSRGARPSRGTTSAGSCIDLIEHLRQLLLVQHLGDVPEALPRRREEARERLKAQANQLERGDRPAADRPARGRGRRHAPGRRPPAAARARARQGDAAGQRPLPRVDRVPPRAARAGTASRRRHRPGGRHRAGSGRAGRRAAARAGARSRSGRRAGSRARAAAGGVGEHGRAGGRGARRDPDGVVARARRIRRSSRRHPHARVRAERPVPPRPRPGPEERGLLADALYDVTGRRLELAFELGEARETPAAEDEPAGEEEFVSQFQQTFDTRERES